MKALLLLCAIAAVAACAPVASGVRTTINQATGDSLVAFFERGSGVVILPGTQATNVVLFLFGENVVSLDAADGCAPFEDAMKCDLGDISSRTVVELTGNNVTGNLRWDRPGSLRPIFLEIVE